RCKAAKSGATSMSSIQVSIRKVYFQTLSSNQILPLAPGYDVPGEGEHKIMDYIRFCKSHRSNKYSFTGEVRHCLYGLDADLINLGLSTHEPYFSLLREEVVFSRNAKRHCDPHKTNFQLLHLSILRDYIYQEFA